MCLDDIRRGLAACGASQILIDLLCSPLDDIQSRAAIIMSDMACVGDNQQILADLGAIPPLVSFERLRSQMFPNFLSELSSISVWAINSGYPHLYSLHSTPISQLYK